MSVSEYERGSTFRTQIYWKSGSHFIDPSGECSYLNVIRSDGTYLIQDKKGIKSDTGIYYYYVSTNSEDPLGLYICEWYGYFSYYPEFGYLPKRDREIVNIVHVKQT